MHSNYRNGGLEMRLNSDLVVLRDGLYALTRNSRFIKAKTYYNLTNRVLSNHMM